MRIIVMVVCIVLFGCGGKTESTGEPIKVDRSFFDSPGAKKVEDSNPKPGDPDPAEKRVLPNPQAQDR